MVSMLSRVSWGCDASEEDGSGALESLSVRSSLRKRRARKRRRGSGYVVHDESRVGKERREPKMKRRGAFWDRGAGFPGRKAARGGSKGKEGRGKKGSCGPVSWGDFVLCFVCGDGVGKTQNKIAAKKKKEKNSLSFLKLEIVFSSLLFSSRSSRSSLLDLLVKCESLSLLSSLALDLISFAKDENERNERN